MIKSKICGVSNMDTLKYIINHPTPPQFIGFICNYQKSKRFVSLKNLKKFTNFDKKNISFVAVLVNPDHGFLEKIKYLNLDYYQLYDVTPEQTKIIKEKYQKKIITAITVKDKKDVKKYKLYDKISEIILFDSKGYEKSLSFNHSLIKNIKIDSEIMLAGNIKYDEDLEKFKKIADIVDISGGLETSDKKDLIKIDYFLKNLNK